MDEKRKEYDRQYLRKLYAKFRERKDRLAKEQFDGRCFLCGSTEGDGSHFHLHHTVYTESSNYTRNSKAMWTREMRLREAEEHPENFALLCEKCHRLVTSVGNYLLTRWQPFDGKLNFDMFAYLMITEMINRQPDIQDNLDLYS